MSIDVLVINLTRFGDLLQSQAVIDDLHEAGHKVGLLCLGNFASALPLIRNVDKAWQLAGAELLSQLARDWRQAWQTVSAFANRIRNESQPRYILNLTPTLTARLLTRLIARSDSKVLGFDLDQFGYGLNHCVWTSFFSVAAAKRTNSPFNLSDLLRMMAFPLTGGLKGSFSLSEPVQTEWAKDFLASQSAGFPQQPAAYVAFQLGASQDARRWPVENFCELGQIIWEKTGYVPVLLGSSSECALGDKYLKHANHPVINAIGKTDIGQLASLLVQTRLLITNDTGTMHLAAGLGVPILAFFLATAQPWDTGPLLPGAISLEPAIECHPCAFNEPCGNADRCRRQISARTAAHFALAQLGRHDQDDLTQATQEARSWQTAPGDDGFTALISSDKNFTAASRWLIWQRRFWRQILDALDKPETEANQFLLSQLYGGLPEIPDSQSLAKDLMQSAALMDTIAECAAKASLSPQMGKIFLRNCERLQAQLDTCNQLSGLAAFWRELRLNQAPDLVLFGRQSHILAIHIRALASALA